MKYHAPRLADHLPPMASILFLWALASPVSHTAGAAVRASLTVAAMPSRAASFSGRAPALSAGACSGRTSAAGAGWESGCAFRLSVRASICSFLEALKEYI